MDTKLALCDLKCRLLDIFCHIWWKTSLRSSFYRRNSANSASKKLPGVLWIVWFIVKSLDSLRSFLSFQQTEQNHPPQKEFHLMKEKCVSWRGSSFHHISSQPRHEASQCRYYSTEFYPKSKSWFWESELDVICCVTIQKLIFSRPSLHSPSCLIASSRSHYPLNSSI